MNRLKGTIRDGCFETTAGRMPVDRPDTAQVVAFFRPESAALARPKLRFPDPEAIALHGPQREREP